MGFTIIELVSSELEVDYVVTATSSSDALEANEAWPNLDSPYAFEIEDNVMQDKPQNSNSYL